MNPRKIKWFVLLSAIIAGVALLIWPINIKPFRVVEENLVIEKEEETEYDSKDDSEDDQADDLEDDQDDDSEVIPDAMEGIINLKEIDDATFVTQDFKPKGEYLEEIGLWFDSIAPGQSGNVRILLKNAAEQTILEKIIPLADLKNREINRLPIGIEVKSGTHYIEISGEDFGEDTISLGMLPKKNEDELAVNYQYRKSFNKIQTLICWLLLAEVWFVIWILLCNFSSDKVKQVLENQNYYIQAGIIFGLISLFMAAAMFSPAVKAEKSLRTLWPGLVFWILFYAVIKKSKFKTKSMKIKRVSFGREQLPLALILLISIGIRIPMLGTIQRWDAGEYYYALGTACQNYQFDLKSFLGFRLCGHSVLGFSLVAAIGEFLSPRNSVGVLLVSLVLTLLALICLYYLFKDAWLKCSPWLAAGFTLLVFSTPIFLGTFAYVNPDYFLVYYFIILLFSDYKKWNLLSLAMAILVSQCKEPGVIVIAFYYGFKIVCDFVHAKGGLPKKATATLRQPSIWIALGSGIVYELLILSLGSIVTWKQSTATGSSIIWSNTGSNCFGFNPSYILFRAGQLFMSNFAWILSIQVLFTAVIAMVKVIRGTHKGESSAANKYIGLVGAMIGFALFSVLYITAMLNRYNILFAVGWSLIGVIAYYYLIGHKRNKVINASVVTIMIAIFLIQSFWNIDAVSSNEFTDVPISDKSTMLLTLPYNDGNVYFGDGLVNNYQYAWLDFGWDKFLRQIEYNETKTILLPREESRGTHINGNGTAYGITWDTQKQKRTIRSEKESEIEINVIGESSIIGNIPNKYFESQHTLEDLPKDIYIPIIEYYGVEEDRVLTSIAPFYYLGESGSVKSYGGTIRYYHAIRKDSYQGFDICSALAWDESEAKTDIKEIDSGFISETYNEIKVDEDLLNVQTYKKSVESKKKMKEDRKIIKQGDIIVADVYAQDQNGNNLGVAYIGNGNNRRYTFKIGSGNYLLGFEEALIGAEIGSPVQAECEIPEGYAPALKYQGEKIKFTIIPIEISKVVNMKTDLEIQSQRRRIEKDIKMSQLMDIIKELSYKISFDSLGCSEKELDIEINKVKTHYKSYIINRSITKQQFLWDYMKIDEGKYNQAVERIAKLNLCREALQERFLNILMPKQTLKPGE